MTASRAAGGLEARLAALAAAAAPRARAEGRSILVSASALLDAPDLLDVLESAERAAATDASLAALVREARMFWSRPSDEFTLAGLGAVAAFSPSGPGRFATVDRAWQAMLDGALHDDAAPEGAPAPALALMGGFAFEPDGPRTAAWQGFPSTFLFVPRLQLAALGAARWITVSALVAPDGTPDRPAAELAGLVDSIRRLAVPWHEAAPARRGDVDVDAGGALVTHARLDDAEWRDVVSSAVAAIDAGGLTKVVLAREVHVTAPRAVDLHAVLRHLPAAHRDCFVFGLWRGERAFVGASPERLARLDGRQVRASSLAGSVRRGETAAEDAALVAELRASAKDLAEHAAVREALRTALAELGGDVSASGTPAVLTLRHVHHLHTAVSATLGPGRTLLDVVARLHPTPAVGGTPRDAALEFIRRHERLDRGWYAAPIGWTARDAGEFAVALRSAVVAGREATLYAGCGIVADSDPAQELAESRLKLRPMLAALAAARDDAAPAPADAAAAVAST